jgi:phosphoglycerate dehydrogenase-like enzyme
MRTRTGREGATDSPKVCPAAPRTEEGATAEGGTSADRPRLLVLLRPREDVREAVRRRLPAVPFAFRDESLPSEWGEVEAVLLGSIAREAPGWDPASMDGLRFIQRVYAGVDDLPFTQIPRQVLVAGNVGGYAPFVAEHAVALALGAVRAIVPSNAAVAAGRLRPAPELGTLWRRRAVILGFGAIGRQIAERLRGFEMSIHGVNRRGDPVAGCERMYPADRLLEALRGGQVVFDARPLTRATERSIGARELAAMAPDGLFVNVGRGATVDEDALYRHLVDHPGFRAAIDVWWDEDFATGRLRSRHPFATLSNFLGSPHCAGIAPPVEAFALECALDNLVRFFSGEAPRHVVDHREYEGLGSTGSQSANEFAA